MKKRWIRFLSFMLCILTLVSCNANGRGDETGSDGSKYVPSEDELLLVANGESYCGVVRARTLSKSGRDLCSDLSDAIYKNTGVVVEMISDTKKLDDGMVEILIGETDRPESAQAMNMLGDFEYSVSVINGKLVVVGSDSVMLEKAIAYLCTLVQGNVWTLSKNYKKIMSGSDYEFNAYFGKGYEFDVKSKQIFKMSVPTATAPSGQSLSCVQGGGTDGKYMYACILNATEDDPSCMILKYDLKTQNRVAISAELKLGHANDIAYNPDEHILLVAHCVQNTSYNGKPAAGLISVFDPDTLALKKTIPLAEGCDISITYNQETKQYITIGVQNNYVYIYDKDFNLVRTITSFGMCKGSFNGKYCGDYLMQGIETDGKYLYISGWHGGSDFLTLRSIEEETSVHLHVMDLETGRQVDMIELGLRREIESFGLIDGKLYIWTNNFTWTGAEFYITELIPKT